MIFIGVTSLNALAVAEELEVGLTVSDNQVSTNGGYSTLQNKDLDNINLLKYRDHALCTTEYLESQIKHFHGIHLDVFKTSRIESALHAALLTNHFSFIKDVAFEVGTEESIYRYDPGFINEFLQNLNLENVRYCVVQGGEYVDCLSNRNNYNEQFLIDQCNTVRRLHLSTKLHNCDFLSIEDLIKRKMCGVDAFNFGPEIAYIENRFFINKLGEQEKTAIIKDMKDKYRWFKNCDNISDDDLLLANLHYHFSREDDEVRKQIAAFLMPRIDALYA